MFKRLAVVGLVMILSACHSTPPPAPPQKTSSAKAADPAAAAKEASDQVNAVQKLLASKHPELASLAPQINRLDVGPNHQILFEILTPEGAVYTNATVDYVLVGNLLVGEQKKVVNFTTRPEVVQALKTMQEAAQAKAQQAQEGAAAQGREIFATLPLDKGLVYTYGKPLHKIAVFEDPDCEHCQQFHKNMEEFGANLDVQVTVFPYVLSSVHPHAADRAKALLCSKDPVGLWRAWMLAAGGQPDMDKAWDVWSKANHVGPAQENCVAATTVKAWQDVGQELGFTGTPTIMFENGAVAVGALSEEHLAEGLAFAAAPPATSTTTAPASLSAPACDGSDPTKCAPPTP